MLSLFNRLKYISRSTAAVVGVSEARVYCSGYVYRWDYRWEGEVRFAGGIHGRDDDADGDWGGRMR